MKELELTKNYQLRTADFDRYGRIQPSSVLDVFQDVASLQATDMGIGPLHVAADGYFWVVVRTKYEVVQPPALHQDVRARTWLYSPTKLGFQRDYQIFDLDGNVLVKGNSEWVLMSRETRTFVPLTQYYKGPTNFSEDRAFPTKTRKVRNFDETGLRPYVAVPTFSDADVNGHVNNTHYATFAVDAFEPTEQQAIKTFQIDWRHEVLAGQPLKIYTSPKDDGLLAKGINAEGETAFACDFVFA